MRLEKVQRYDEETGEFLKQKKRKKDEKAEAERLLDVYNDVMKAKDGFIDFSDANALKGHSTQEADQKLIPYFSEDKTVNVNVDLHWTFDKPPTVTSHRMDRYSVSIDLISVVPASQAYT